jgi:hypothetical protein
MDGRKAEGIFPRLGLGRLSMACAIDLLGLHWVAYHGASGAFIVLGFL